MKIKPRDLLLQLAAYELADTSVPAGKRLLQLAQNESAFPPPAHVLEAARGAVDQAVLYPDPDFGDLRTAIAETFSLERDRILCGCGSMDLIALLTAAYLEPGESVVCSEYSYLFFRSCARIADADIVVVPEKDLTVDVDLLLGGVREDTKMVFLANPGNPTGTFLSKPEVQRLRAGLRDDILLILDEAYGEFVDAAVYQPCFDLADGGNTVVLRTFSKIYGLASMRVGWGYFPAEVIDILRRIQHPNSVSAASQAAAASAVRDQGYVDEIRETTALIRARFAGALAKQGIEVLNGYANFVLVVFHSKEEAASFSAYLKSEGIVVRAMGGYGLGHAVRITMGTETDMEDVASVVADWKKQENRGAA